MRDIRFRAWDKRTEQMYDYHALDETLQFHFDGRISEWDENAPALDGFEKGSYVENNKDFILMQYTGLKDKNGKEVYDGDVVEFDEDQFCIIGIGKYTVYRSVGCTEVEDYYYGVYLNVYYKSDRELDGRFNCLHEDYNVTKSKVIGNIYENPKLINNKK